MGEDGFNTFVASIPYNFYALLTIFFVFFMLFLQKDFGPMAAAQADAEGRIPAEARRLRRCPSPASPTRPRSIWKARRTFPPW